MVDVGSEHRDPGLYVSAGFTWPLIPFCGLLRVIKPNFPSPLAAVHFKASGTPMDYKGNNSLVLPTKLPALLASLLCPLSPSPLTPTLWIQFLLPIDLLAQCKEGGGQGTPQVSKTAPNCCGFCHPDLQGHSTKKSEVKNGYYIRMFLDIPNCEIDTTGVPVWASSSSRYSLKTLGATEIITLIQMGLSKSTNDCLLPFFSYPLPVLRAPCPCPLSFKLLNSCPSQSFSFQKAVFFCIG